MTTEEKNRERERKLVDYEVFRGYLEDNMYREASETLINNPKIIEFIDSDELVRLNKGLLKIIDESEKDFDYPMVKPKEAYKLELEVKKVTRVI